MRQIICAPEFDDAVERLGGMRAIDDAMEPVIERLRNNPYGFDRFESDNFSYRWVRTHATTTSPPLVIFFEIDDRKNVVLTHVEKAPP